MARPRLPSVWLSPMIGLTLALSLAVALGAAPLRAETVPACPVAEPSNADAISAALRKAGSCKAALQILNGCSWGSSVDTEFGALTVARCERDFFAKLSRPEQETYAGEMQACAYRYSLQSGTMYISAAALCQADVAARFAADPALARTPPSRASFDCAKAKTPIERSICAVPALGRADVMLNRVWQQRGSALKDGDDGRQATLYQKQWMDKVIARCKPDGTAAAGPAACLRAAFEQRFTQIDGCEDLGCLDPDAVGDEDGATAPAQGQRASFDCHRPQTPLEIVICADQSLGQADIAMAAAYKSTLDGSGDKERTGIVQSQRDWLNFVETRCPLGAVGGIPPALARACVSSAFKVRTDQLNRCKANGDFDGPCLTTFRIGP